MLAIHRPTQALRGPAVEHRHIRLQRGHNALGNLRSKQRCTGKNLIGIDTRIIRPLPGEAKLAGNVLPQGQLRVVLALAQPVHVEQPDIKYAVQDPPVQRLFARKVIQQVLLGRTDRLGNMVQRHPAVATLGEQLFGGVQDVVLQLLAAGANPWNFGGGVGDRFFHGWYGCCTISR